VVQKSLFQQDFFKTDSDSVYFLLRIKYVRGTVAKSEGLVAKERVGQLSKRDR
jgi:hypothetical protein